LATPTHVGRVRADHSKHGSLIGSLIGPLSHIHSHHNVPYQVSESNIPHLSGFRLPLPLVHRLRPSPQWLLHLEEVPHPLLPSPDKPHHHQQHQPKPPPNRPNHHQQWVVHVLSSS